MATRLDHKGWTAVERLAPCGSQDVQTACHPAITTGQAVPLDLRNDMDPI
jgi:hypothetical protein